MIKENKVKVVLSCIAIIIPVLFGVIMWDSLPDAMPIHWGADGNSDGFTQKVFAVFGLPVILLACHLFCLFITSLDKKQKNQNKKALGMVFWIIPFISLFSSSFGYAAALGKKISTDMIMPVMLGVMFILIGNYMPKIKQNGTLGIRIPWTLSNEENWNKTHRLGGKVWVIGGLIMVFSVFLPSVAMIPVFIIALVVMMIIPLAYSYSLYKKDKTQNIAYTVPSKSKAEKIIIIISAIVVPLILINSAVMMFTGDMEVICEDSYIEINTDHWKDLKVDYSTIDTVSYRTELDAGMRTYGFGSPRLSLGNFKNDEFGPYVLYAYADAKEFVVLTLGEDILVIGMADTQETKEIYDAVLAKISK